VKLAERDICTRYTLVRYAGSSMMRSRRAAPRRLKAWSVGTKKV
jgi:hypothetical protein